MKKIGWLLLVFWLVGSVEMAHSQMSIAKNNDSDVAQKSVLEEQVAAAEKKLLKGFPQDALQLLDSAILQMTGDEPTALQVKAHILYISTMAQYQEDMLDKSIRHLEALLPDAGSPAQEIYHSYLAELYGMLPQQTRQKTSADEDDNFETWSKEQITQATLQHALLSLNNEKVLREQKVENFAVILNEDDDPERCMPTVYEVLMHRFFQQIEKSVSSNTHREWLVPLPEFLKMEITADSTEIDKIVAQKFQQLLQYHYLQSHSTLTVMAPKNPLIYFDLARLRFFDPEDNCDSLKINALDYLLETFRSESTITTVHFEKAQLLDRRYYHPNTGENRYARQEAAEVCRAAIALKPNSLGAKNCATLLEKIEAPEYHVDIESSQPILQPALMRVRFCNLTSLCFRVYRLTDAQVYTSMSHLWDYRQRECTLYEELLREGKPEMTWSVTLPEQTDYRPHTTEVELPALNAGFYLIFCNLTNSFNTKEEYAVAPVQVSNLQLVLLDENREQRTVILVDRRNGTPINNATITLGSEKSRQMATLKTDKNGIVKLPKNIDNQQIYITASTKNDTFRSSVFQLSKKYTPEIPTDIHLFTDRALYRPGETVYFKGVAYRQETKMWQTVAQKKITVKLRDVNWQVLEEQTFTTDDMGGFHGSYTLPKELLNGTMMLDAGSTTQRFRVETYRAPRFLVETEPISETAALNDTVAIKGKAMMLNGLPLENATITYTIHRVNYRRYWFEGEDEILSATTQTAGDGSFSCPFFAAPKNDQKSNCFYLFRAELVVTDITGETHHHTSSVWIGDKPLTINLKTDDVMISGENDLVKFSVSNSNYATIAHPATLRIERLPEPDRIYTERRWEFPELRTISRDQFEQKFPQFRFEPPTNEEGTEVFRKDFSADEPSQVSLSELNLTTGTYKIYVSTQTEMGTTVDNETVINFVNINDKKHHLVTNAMLKIAHSHLTLGDTLRVYYASAAPNAQLFYSITTNDASPSMGWLPVSTKTNVLEIATGTKITGDFVINLLIVNNNRCHHTEQYVTVTDPSERLKMEVSGIRDKTQPGAHEQWQVRIFDHTGAAINSTMFAVMYDAALDQIEPHFWNLSPIRRTPRPELRYLAFGDNSDQLNFYNKTYNYSIGYQSFTPRNLNWFNFPIYRYNYFRYARLESLGIVVEEGSSISAYGSNDAMVMKTMEIAEDEWAVDDAAQDADTPLFAENPETPSLPISVRQNFNETAFFYPDLRTDTAGNLLIEFVLPESSTRWNMMGIAYTPTMQTVCFDTTIVTQSDFLVLPNLPRFLRAGDECRFITRIANNTNEPLKGVARLQLEDPVTGKTMDAWITDEMEKPFEMAAHQSITVSWNVQTTAEVDLLHATISATSGAMTDGEKHLLPILPAETTALETIAVELSQAGTHHYELTPLADPETTPQSITIEMTTHPIWYAIQALPTFANVKYNSTDNIFYALYSNLLSHHILVSQPEIRQTFDLWRQTNPDALLSKLEQNEEVKNIVLSETPWVIEAKNETARQKQIAHFFDINYLNSCYQSDFRKLKERQRPSGAFVWFPGMNESSYITETIVIGIGKLQAMQQSNNELNTMAERAVRYLDQKLVNDYHRDTTIVTYSLHYLAARSHFMHLAMNAECTAIFEKIVRHAIAQSLTYSFNQRAELILSLHRIGREKEAENLARSLDNYSIGDETTGKYWRTQQGSLTASDIALSAAMAEIYHRILNDETALAEVQKFLIRNKRTNEWLNAPATADAIYALLLRGQQPLQAHTPVTIKIGNETICSDSLKTQAGTGYFRQTWSKADITAAMKNIDIETNSNQLLFGGIYLQYQKPIAQIDQSTSNDLSVKQQLFTTTTHNGKQTYEPLSPTTALKVGDKVVVRLEVTAQRDMDYVHLRDLFGGGFEPVEQRSEMVWGNGIGYYREQKLDAINLFFDRLPRGTFVIEYELFATQNGTFTNGYSTIQCLYAPEFAGNEAGKTVKIR